MRVERVVKQLSEKYTEMPDIFDETIFANNTLNFERSGARHRMTLIGVAMSKCTMYGQ